MLNLRSIVNRQQSHPVYALETVDNFRRLEPDLSGVIAYRQNSLAVQLMDVQIEFREITLKIFQANVELAN